MSSDLDWHRDDSVVVRDQPGIAVFVNVHGYIAIRQRGDMDPRTLETDDAVVVVAREHAAELAHAILALAEPKEAPQLALPAPDGKTAADRQRRYRARKRYSVTVPERDDRNAVTHDAVTSRDDRNAGTVTERDGDDSPPSRYWPPKDGAGR